ncbi:hypothetical protein [Campylobacter rectus]|nr:hypothetical protein [Campylobacter rectus]
MQILAVQDCAGGGVWSFGVRRECKFWLPRGADTACRLGLVA